MTVAPPLPLESYWADFEVDDSDIELVYNLMLEREAPLTAGEMGAAIIAGRIERLRRQAEEAAKPEHTAYRPGDRYEAGTQLSFPALQGKVGVVTGVRQGENPGLGAFEVIAVSFDDDGGTREFASSFEEHALNQVPDASEDQDQLLSPEGVLSAYGALIEARLTAHLEQQEDIVRIAWRWFPRALLAEIHEGHLNLAEAVLDVASGGPLPTTSLLEHIELPDTVDPLLAAFSLDYALQEDERFDEVGPAGEVLWFLQRNEPPEVLYTPSRLQFEPIPYNRNVLTPDLLDLERRLDDELNPQEGPVEEATELTIPVLFPHWRVGALPLSARLRPFFPTAYEAPRIRFVLVDGHTGDKFPGWVVRKEAYVFGLDEWYRRHHVPAGGLVRIRPGDAAGEVVVQAVDRRTRSDWIRTVSIDQEGQIGFTMLKQPVGTAYDERMVVGLVDPAALDEAWMRGSQRKMSLERLAAYVFRELAKLNPQSAVHAQAFYSGLNVLRRIPPGPLFALLMERPYYEHVGDLYWRFDDSQWN